MTIKHLFHLVCLFVSIHNLEAQQLIEKTLLHDGETRAYTVYIPTNYQADSPIPLLFNFHGGSGDIAGHLWVSDMRPIADTAGLIVVYPQALSDPNAGGSAIWTHKAPTEVDDIFFVEAMIDTLAAEYAIDENRVYAFGYSNGGEFALELACRLSHRIAAVGSVARSMFIETFENCAPSHPTAVVTIHGTKDDYDGITFGGTTFYLSLNDLNNYWSNYNQTDTNPVVTSIPNTNSADGTTVEHFSWNNGNGCVSVEHFKVNSGGHDWPGSFGNMDIDASEELWNFVSRYDMDGLISCQATSIQEANNLAGEISIFPNPVKDFLTIEMETTKNQTYHLYATSGELLRFGQVDSRNKTIDLSALPTNIYLLKVKDTILKFIKIE